MDEIVLYVVHGAPPPFPLCQHLLICLFHCYLHIKVCIHQDMLCSTANSYLFLLWETVTIFINVFHLLPALEFCFKDEC